MLLVRVVTWYPSCERIFCAMTVMISFIVNVEDIPLPLGLCVLAGCGEDAGWLLAGR